MTKQKIAYLIGVCGTAMSALAAMLQDQGFRVIGSDAHVYPPMSDFLAQRGVEILPGYKATNIDAASPDLVIIGNAIRAINPEAQRVMELGLDYTSLPQALGRHFISGRQAVVAAGTHGKTTTSALVAWLLDQAGQDPSFLVGGITANYRSNYKLGKGPYFVIEGDEYDTAFFEKTPKFIHYHPLWTILTSVEFDHADIYPDFEAVKKAFTMLTDLIPATGRLMVFSGAETALELAGRAACPVLTYGFNPGDDVSAANISLGPETVSFDLVKAGRNHGRFSWPHPGRHNLANALAALGLLMEMGIDPEIMKPGLASFRGVKRRQEIIGRINDIVVIDDFAHHPTAVRETLAALADFYPDRRLVVAFEPRTNTSRRNFFQRDYPESFSKADVVLIRKPPLLEGVPPEERFSSERLAADLGAAGLEAGYFENSDDLLAAMLDRLRPGDLAVIMSNGGFDGLHGRLLAGLEAGSTEA